MKIVIEVHYPKDEPYGDYTDVVVKVDGEIAAAYVDGYHSRGRERAAGFVEGLKYGLRYMSFPILVEEVHVDDR